jgi:hypothetical protein
MDGAKNYPPAVAGDQPISRRSVRKSDHFFRRTFVAIATQQEWWRGARVP